MIKTSGNWYFITKPGTSTVSFASEIIEFDEALKLLDEDIHIPTNGDDKLYFISDISGNVETRRYIDIINKSEIEENGLLLKNENTLMSFNNQLEKFNEMLNQKIAEILLRNCGEKY